MNWVDGIIITILIISTVRGYSEGFILSLMKIAGLVTSIVVARLYFADLADYLKNNTNLYHKIYAIVSKGLQAKSPSFWDTGTGNTKFMDMLENLALYINSTEGGIAVTSGIAERVSDIIMCLLSIALLFVAVRIIFFVVTALLNSVTGLPVLRQFNKLAGLIVGALKGILMLMIIFALVIPIITILPIKWLRLMIGIQDSAVAMFFCRNNFIMSWMMEIISRMV